MDQQDHFCTQERRKVLAMSHAEILGWEFEGGIGGEEGRGHSSNRKYRLQTGRSVLNLQLAPIYCSCRVSLPYHDCYLPAVQFSTIWLYLVRRFFFFLIIKWRFPRVCLLLAGNLGLRQADLWSAAPRRVKSACSPQRVICMLSCLIPIRGFRGEGEEYKHRNHNSIKKAKYS